MNDKKYDKFSFWENYSAEPSTSAFERHMHSEYELYYFLQGDADYLVGDKLYNLQPKSLLFIRPTVYHCLKLKSRAPYRRIVINFDEAYVPEDVRRELCDYNTHYTITDGSTIDKLYDCAVNTMKRRNSAEIDSTLWEYANLILYELKFDKSADEITHVNIDTTLSKVLNYIDENINKPLSMNLIENEFFISPSWLTHTFKKHMGITLMQYVNRKKILTAAKLIANGTPIMQAADMCGFENYSTFYNQYKKILGNAPSKSAT